MKLKVDDVRSRFIKHLGGEPGSVYASPGRINLIGEHTDYNGGFVFPGAVEQGMIAEVRPNGTRTIRAYSIDLKDYDEFSIDDEKGPKASHFRYIFGVVREMMACQCRASTLLLLAMCPMVQVCLHRPLSKVAMLLPSTTSSATTRLTR